MAKEKLVAVRNARRRNGGGHKEADEEMAVVRGVIRVRARSPF
jgi:hypothetical protein